MWSRIARLRHLLATVREANAVGAGRSTRLRGPGPTSKWQHLRWSSNGVSAGGDHVKFGNLKIDTPPPESPWLVSRIYARETKLVPTALEHLRWMAQKTKLGQDVFLLGPPGPQKRQLALLLCSILNREYEYVAITRDTTESDLKQRKEIQKGSTRFVDQGVIEAALHGRILIIDGIEKAERNVLPVLNNLLENREMQLEDGRFLMHPTRYDELLEKYGKEKLDVMKIVRVHPDFVIVGLGIPVPTFPGHPLDPPLRSRFQCRHVGPLPYSELIQQTESLVSPGLGGITSKQLCSWAYSLLSEEWKVMGLPHFPSGSIPVALKLMNNIGDHETVQIINRLYPWELFPVMQEAPSKDRRTMSKIEAHPVVKSLEKFGFAPRSGGLREVVGVKSVSDTEADVTVKKDGSSCTFRVPIGNQTLGAIEDKEDFVATSSLSNLLAEMIETHSVHDMCVVGPQGCGKTVVTHEFARLLGYDIEPVVMFQDMTARDLTQQRGTGPDGDTYWRLSPLVSAVLNGRLAVLDGLHRVHASTLNVLHRLIHEREMHLHDGRRILSSESYDELKEQLGCADEEMTAKGILRAHPSFRMIALAEASPGSSSQRKASGTWLNAEILSMFMFHQFPESSWVERLRIVTELYGKPEPSMEKIMKLSQLLSESKDPVQKSLGSSLSFRQLLRAARILKHHPDESPVELVHRACLRKFLPVTAREVLDDVMKEVGLVDPTSGGSAATPTWELGGGKLKIGRVEIAIKDPESIAKVPYSKFFDIRQQLVALEGMLSDFILGEHLLLIGNQGVGKNRLADRMLNLLSQPREYIQLHRDTTVSSLTVQPTVREGVVSYEDSPLVTAVRKGYVLVVDEADKAPTQVTCILKTLVEEGEMVLSDGRRIVPAHTETDDPNSIKIHPDFRMIVLANRPGFPFLGNDFYAVLGDVFSCHVIDNPDFESEMSLLAQYGPEVPKHVLTPLAKAFQDLRRLADEGVLPYPYSTREAVAVVKHLQSFPDDGLNDALRNVFDFEAYSKENMETVTTILSKHGIPIASTAASVNLAEEKPLPNPTVIGSWTILRDTRKKLPRQHRPLRVKGPVEVESATAVLDRVESRITGFSEETAYWQMPITAYDNVNDITTFRDGNETFVYVATGYPPSVYELNLSSGHVSALRIRKAMGHSRPVYSSDKKFSLQPLPLVSAGGGPLLLLHDAETNSLNLVDPRTREITRLLTSTTTEAVTDGVMSSFRFTSKPAANFKMVPLDGTCEVSLFEPGGQSLGFVNAEQRVYSEVSVPFALRNVFPLDEDTWLLLDDKKRKYYLSKCHSNTVAGYYVEEIASHFRGPCLDVEQISVEGLSNENLHAALKEKLSSPNSVVATTESYADLIIGFPQLKSSPNEIYRFPRPTPLDVSNDRHKTVMLPHEGLIVRALPPNLQGNAHMAESLSGVLEVVNLPSNTVKTIPVKSGSYAGDRWQDNRRAAPELWIDRINDVSGDPEGGDLVSLDNTGCLRLWQIQPDRVRTALSKWRDLVGRNSAEVDAPQLTIHRANWRDLSGPKHGKIDPKNAPHVGGNTWAGGTGGRDTAGLGGRGGPYRLDAGHPVFQVSDAEKAAVPPEVLAAAREVAQETFKKRMAEIHMDPLDVQLYQSFMSRIEPEVKKLRAIISSLQAKDKERQWVNLQTHGDLDDTRIVEGLTGEKTIYRRRVDKEPELGALQEKPKHIRLVVDVSGSMYRFNGYDGRLLREQEAVLLMMEAFQGTGDKIRYDITGHSGDTESISFITQNSPPANPKDRFKVLQLMEAHSQFCFSGDNTINAIERAVREVGAMEGVDERFVVVLSDANLERYGISPRRLSQAVASQPDVNVTAVFIGSLGPQADVLKQALPAGRGYVCMDTKQLPHIMQQIFASSLLR